MPVPSKSVASFREDIREAILALTSDFDVGYGPVRDLVIDPMAQVLGEEHARVRALSLLLALIEFSDEDLEAFDDQNNDLGSVYEASVRYEGMFNNVGVILGAGYTHAELEEDTDAINNEDDRTAWNIGADFDIGPFGIGAAYLEDDYAENVAGASDDEETWVLGVDYTTGPFKLGASYLDVENTRNIAGNTAGTGVESQRYTGGVTYTYGPGMTFRGSVSYVEHENVAGLPGTATELEATSFTLGTQVAF